MLLGRRTADASAADAAVPDAEAAAAAAAHAAGRCAASAAEATDGQPLRRRHAAGAEDAVLRGARGVLPQQAAGLGLIGDVVGHGRAPGTCRRSTHLTEYHGNGGAPKDG
jgi:hypothetical protein